MQAAFVIGSPRSGTTILGNILNRHPEIAEWYEPYYLWEKHFPCKEDDMWSEEYLNERTKKSIQREYSIYSNKAKKPIVLEKSPGHELNVRIVVRIFPDAKWIHVVRDGRDVTLSIRKEWDRRARIVRNRDFLALFRAGLNMIQRQPFWRYKLMAIIHEIRSNSSLNPQNYLNKSRWEGNEGWGNRFQGWKEYLQSHSTIEFNAMQWVKSIEAVQKNWHLLPEKNKIEIRYEDLLRSPEEILGNIFAILGVAMSTGFLKMIPPLKRDNFHKWNREFDAEELRRISPVLTAKLIELGYENNPNWAKEIGEPASNNKPNFA